MTEALTPLQEPASPAPGSPPRGGARRDAVAILGTMLVLGVLAGVAWWLLVDPALYTKVAQGGTMGEVQLAKRFDPDGWFAVIAAVTGLVAGGVLTWWRNRDHVATTLLLLAGAAVASAAMALTGHVLGPPDPATVIPSAPIGALIPSDLAVTAKATYLVWPIATLVGALMVLWSTPGGGDGAEPSPGTPDISGAPR